MKKSVVILIAIIYAASIALVSFWGLRAINPPSAVYVTEMKLVDGENKNKISEDKNNAVTDKDGNETARLWVLAEYVEEEDVWTYQITCELTPEDASDLSLTYILGITEDDEEPTLDENGEVITADEETVDEDAWVTVDANGLVTFREAGSVMVTVKAKGANSDVQAQLMIYAMDFQKYE